MPVHQHWLTGTGTSRERGIRAVRDRPGIDTGHADRTWAIWAAVAYGVTTLLIWLTRRQERAADRGRCWCPLAGALAAPVTWLATRVAPTPEVQVISRSAVLLLQHGTPYLPQGQLDTLLSYNPYLPFMAVFGLPKALGATGLFGRPPALADGGVHRADLGGVRRRGAAPALPGLPAQRRCCPPSSSRPPR